MRYAIKQAKAAGSCDAQFARSRGGPVGRPNIQMAARVVALEYCFIAQNGEIGCDTPVKQPARIGSYDRQLACPRRSPVGHPKVFKAPRVRAIEQRLDAQDS